MSFNTLYHGAPDEAADILDGDNPTEDPALLRAALTNALRRIATLERLVTSLRKDLEE